MACWQFIVRMKELSILAIVFSVISCQQVDYGLDPVLYELNEVFNSGYDILTEGNNPSDNIIFSSCNTFVYDYSITKGGKEYVAKYVDKIEKDMFENWEYMEKRFSVDSTYIHKFIYLQPKSADRELSPNQSVIKVYWVNSDNTLISNTSEGIIENHKNLWMHPLRGYQMWPTFTAPWPYVQFPISVGDKYTWWKKLDGGWGSDRYVQWDKIMHFDYVYEVIGTEVVVVNDQGIECYKIEATGTSEIGNTRVFFYFNPRLGFVKMDYHLMDDSNIVMNMIDFELDCDRELEIPEYE